MSPARKLEHTVLGNRRRSLACPLLYSLSRRASAIYPPSCLGLSFERGHHHKHDVARRSVAYSGRKWVGGVRVVSHYKEVAIWVGPCNGFFVGEAETSPSDRRCSARARVCVCTGGRERCSLEECVAMSNHLLEVAAAVAASVGGGVVVVAAASMLPPPHALV